MGIPIHLHTNETLEDVEKTIKMHGMRPIELASKYNILSSGDFAAHCVHVDSNEIDILAAEDVKKINIFSRLFRSLNYLVWGDA